MPAEGPSVHTDAVQAFISEDVTVATTGADMISIAAHKLGGPKGAGLLYVRNGIELEPVLHGGGQELGGAPAPTTSQGSSGWCSDGGERGRS